MLVTGEREKNLISSVNIIAQQLIDPDLSKQAEEILGLGQTTVKPELEEKLGDLWAVIFGSYSSKEIPKEDIKKLEATLELINFKLI